MPGIDTPPKKKTARVPAELTTLRKFRNINDPFMRLASRTPVRYDPSVRGGGYTYYGDPTVYLGTPNDFQTYLHEVAHQGSTLPGATDAPNFWPQFGRAADALSRSNAYRGLPNSLTSNPRIPYPFRLPVTARYAPGARMSTTFPGIGGNPMLGTAPNEWGGPGEFFASLLAAAFASTDRIPPPMRRFYRGLIGSYTQVPPPFGTPPTRDD